MKNDAEVHLTKDRVIIRGEQSEVLALLTSGLHTLYAQEMVNDETLDMLILLVKADKKDLNTLLKALDKKGSKKNDRRKNTRTTNS